MTKINKKITDWFNRLILGEKEWEKGDCMRCARPIKKRFIKDVPCSCKKPKPHPGD